MNEHEKMIKHEMLRPVKKPESNGCKNVRLGVVHE